MTNTIRLKITCFLLFVIDQGYIGLSLASCHKDEIWDLQAELGFIWDHFRALGPHYEHCIGLKNDVKRQ